MSKQQTAIIYLVEELIKLGYLHSENYGQSQVVKKAIEQSKAMEKEQMKEAVLSQVTKHKTFRNLFEKQFEQYYNETYESNGSDDHIGDVNEMVEISDEEIIKLANEYILYNDSKRQWVIEGMKLYREQLKINNK